MRDDRERTSTYELLPVAATAQNQTDFHDDSASELFQTNTRMSGGLPNGEDERQHLKAASKVTWEETDAPPPGSRHRYRLPSGMLLRDVKELVLLLCVLLTVIPVIMLTRYAPQLSKNLGSKACLPNGEFVFPGQASIWNVNYFFTISITLGVGSGWGYTRVKVIVRNCWRSPMLRNDTN